MSALEDVVIEGQDRTNKVQGGVESVGEVVAESEVLHWLGAKGNAIAFGVDVRLKVFLLKWISLV